MSEFLDLSGADTSGFDPLPSGEYDATVISAEFTHASTGAPMVKVSFGIAEEEYEGRKVFTNYVLRGKTDDGTKRLLGSFVQFVAAASGEDIDEVKKAGFDPENLEDLIGNDVVLRLGPPDEGYDWNKVKGVKPAGTKVGSTSDGLL